MSKKVISILFSVTFSWFVAMPTILVILDDTTDISMFFSISEEEEKGSEKVLDVEVLLSLLKTNDLHLVFTSIENNVGYSYKKYPKPHLHTLSPPPESHIV